MKKTASIVVTFLVAIGCGIGLLTFIHWTRYRATIAPLKSSDNAIRENAIKALRGGGPETAQVLAAALKDKDIRVRVGAARALGEFGPKALEGGANPIPALRDATKDADQDVRDAASTALRKINPLTE